MMKNQGKMIKVLHYLCLSLVFVFGLVAIIGTGGCGGGSSGGGGGGGGSTSLATGEFTKTIDPTDDINHSSDFSGATYHSQKLYPASEINGSGNITSILVEYSSDEAADITCADVTIKMGHTTLSSLGATYANNVEQGAGSVQTVLTNGSIVFPVGMMDDWSEIPLDTPFYYNGVDNLVVDITTNVGCSALFNTDVTTGLGYTASVYSYNIAATTGNDVSWRADMEFNFEGGVNSVEFAPIPSNGNTYPFGGLRDKVQLLYDATLINGSGPVTGIAMRVGHLTTTAQSYTYTMRVGHSTLTDLTTDFNGNFSDTPVTVANNAVFNVPAGIPVGDYIWIPMPDGSFNYNGNNNLIVEIDVSSSSGNTYWGLELAGPNMSRAWGATGSDTASGVGSEEYHISFRFNGGTMDRLTPAASSHTSYPFSISYGGRQYLYTASELGTKATITKVALRLSWPSSTAEDYSNFTVTMGHTSLAELTDVFGDNMDDATEVYKGTYSMPAGLIEGDWIEMTLDSPFIYNGTENLVVSFESDGGATGHSVILGSNRILYPNRTLLLPDRLQNYLADIRFWVQ